MNRPRAGAWRPGARQRRRFAAISFRRCNASPIPVGFARLSARVLPFSTALTIGAIALGLYLGLSSRPPTTSRARPCGSSMSTCPPPGWRCSSTPASRPPAPARSIWRHPLARSDRPGRLAAGRRLHLHRAGLRLALGQAHVGHLLGLGRAPHLDADPVLPLSRPYGAAQRLRRCPAAATGRPPSWRSSASSTCRSSNSRSIGGTRCISRRACSAWAGRRSIPRS